jgi:PAS domain-containing protein
VLPNTKGDLRHLVSTYIPDIGLDGTVRGFFVLATDTTERKAIETNLFEEKERFRVTLESIKDGVITTDKDGRITYCRTYIGRAWKAVGRGYGVS